MKIYLAIPYSGYEEKSFKMANKYAGEIMQLGHTVFSPISQNHPIAKAVNLPTEWDFWEKFDRSFIEWADVVFIVPFKDFRLSKGVMAEIKISEQYKKPVFTINSDIPLSKFIENVIGWIKTK